MYVSSSLPKPTNNEQLAPQTYQTPVLVLPDRSPLQGARSDGGFLGLSLPLTHLDPPV